MTELFRGNFTQQEPLSETAIAAAVAVMRSGRLHRYNTSGDEVCETALLELEFRDYIGARYCLAVASGGYALTTALRATGVTEGTPVLTNAFTLSPVPGAIAAAGGRPVLVEIDENLCIDVRDLDNKIATSGARLLLISHMRGHIADMDALLAVCQRNAVTIIEDCAHTMGASWNGVKSGRHGAIACYSTQTYKHLNSGEGGFIVSDDPILMARATILSGSYMLYGKHPAGPDVQHYTNQRLDTPNCSGRMDNLRAAVLRPQLQLLDENAARWNERYRTVERELGGIAGLVLPERHAAEHFVASSIQFRLPALDPAAIRLFLNLCLARGVEIKWFGAADPIAYTSNHHSWRYLGPQHLPETDRVLAALCDMRLPLTFSLDDCRLIGRIIRQSALAVMHGGETQVSLPANAREIS